MTNDLKVGTNARGNTNVFQLPLVTERKINKTQEDGLPRKTTQVEKTLSGRITLSALSASRKESGEIDWQPEHLTARPELKISAAAFGSPGSEASRIHFGQASLGQSAVINVVDLPLVGLKLGQASCDPAIGDRVAR